MYKIYTTDEKGREGCLQVIGKPNILILVETMLDELSTERPELRDGFSNSLRDTIFEAKKEIERSKA